METFHELLRRYEEAESEADRTLAEEELWRAFGVEGAVMVLDMAGFSLLTLRYGVVHYLAMVRRMQRVVRPVVERHRGRVVKFEADNCFARFPTVEGAVMAAVEVHRAFTHLNALRDSRSDITVSSGVDFGRFLLVGGRDYFGSPVNLASKLGEDIAQAGEILVSSTAMERMGELPPPLRGEPMQATVSGLEITAIRILW